MPFFGSGRALLAVSAVSLFGLCYAAAPALGADVENPANASSSARSGATPPGVQSVFDCRALKDAPSAHTPVQWFERSIWAAHCYVYEARAVRISGPNVVSLSLSRDIRDGVERDRLHILDGPNRSLVREGGTARFQLSESGDAAAPASPEALAAHLGKLYRFQFDGQERIANRTALRLLMRPADDMRYGYHLWLDQATGLVLKRVLLDEQGRPLETYQLVELTPPELYDGEVRLRQPDSSAEPDWKPSWLPPGFIAQPLISMAGAEGVSRQHRFYSDGLVTISLFVEPVPENGGLRPGVHQLGASYAAVKRLEEGDSEMQVVVVGELPPDILVRVADSLEYSRTASRNGLSKDSSSRQDALERGSSS
uniref:MucB/RseB C-terminal domain-containing protein n=1 Tax=Halomonas sp. TaxID=1486246 RepID=UPI002637E0ED|nr:MucB/RseB C-terminal domain-containing protein [Halomonas sp.]